MEVMKGYHLTQVKNLYGEDGIGAKGLIPQCGERSRSVGDNREVICFTANYYTLKVWWLFLYHKLNPNELCVLTFDVPKEKTKRSNTEFTIDYILPPDHINVASFYNKDTCEVIPFYLFQEGKTINLGWGLDEKAFDHMLELRYAIHPDYRGYHYRRQQIFLFLSFQ